MNAERPRYYGTSPEKRWERPNPLPDVQPPRGGSGQSKGEPSVVGGSAWRYKRAWSEAVDERDRALAERDRAVAELAEPRRMSDVATSPDCRVGKHGACSGDAWDNDRDQPAACTCHCHEEN